MQSKFEMQCARMHAYWRGFFGASVATESCMALSVALLASLYLLALFPLLIVAIARSFLK